SFISGEHVSAALNQRGYDTVLIEIDNLDDLVPSLAGVDIAFNCLHGGSGENGTVQLLLDVLDLPYPGSGPQASALCMDKPRAKETLSRQGIPIPRGTIYKGEDVEALCAATLVDYELPLVCKPCNQGSSLGVRIVECEPDLVKAGSEILSKFGSLLIEEYIPGRELTAGILLLHGKDRVLPLVEVEPKSGFFDYTAKYSEGMSEFLVPAPLDRETTHLVQEVSLAAHKALSCSGFSRVDLRLDEEGRPFVLEVNTLPGMTPMSDLPRAAAAARITFPGLVEIMLETALQRRS
ncbi:D-alanine--D-alanine ligase, partial [Candidatus Bipolaricaulota bacterium]|nr:D-alanine--D-alanine ligase [Candidatus Bipolaricaulota bacterium]